MAVFRGKEYANIVGYGAAGGYYEKTKRELATIMNLDYLCDRKWENSGQKEHDGIPLIHMKDLKNLDDALVIIFASGHWMYEAIKSDLDALGMEYVHVNEVIGCNKILDGKMLKEQFPDGCYEDMHGNKIYFDQTLSDKITVLLGGSNNLLKIGKNVTAANFLIVFGNNGSCTIGDNTEIIGAEFYIAHSGIRVGEDCLFSTQVVLRTHDGHHIFDANTHQRINYPKDIEIGNHVWIGFRVMLLGGARIGTGSLVGANAVTSGQFGEHSVIVGTPAKVIRENVCWSRDDTEYFNWSRLEECVSKEALKYF
ncbi:MAG: acyltransferase [Lachnospiraceae bacterium]|nr:acyltransferase [Lachnospiraceae bacterium]MDE6183875.1 acyltransferase [Lachnospiraceae bacterium]